MWHLDFFPHFPCRRREVGEEVGRCGLVGGVSPPTLLVPVPKFLFKAPEGPPKGLSRGLALNALAPGALSECA